jgi:hypothetical protein
VALSYLEHEDNEMIRSLKALGANIGGMGLEESRTTFSRWISSKQFSVGKR